MSKTKEGTQRHEALGESETSNDGLARPDVWWAGTAGTVTASTLLASTQVPPSVPHQLGTMGCTIILEVWLYSILTSPFPT